MVKILFLSFLLMSADPAPSSTESAPSVKSSEESYATVVAKVSALEAKIKSAEADIQKLLEEKSTAKPERVGEITVQAQQLHNKMQEQVREYEQQRSLLKYRYPDKGRTDKRVYERIDLKSINQMEEEVGLAAALSKSMQKVRNHYGIPKKEEPAKAKSKSAPAGNILEPVILKK